MIVKYKSDNHMADKKVNMELVELDHDHYYKISNHDLMRPFFMSIVSDSNHWMFISSNGGLTAGRKNAEFALFPYYTDDKITESADITGSKSIFQINKGGETILWEPFSERFNDRYQISRNLYKNKYGNKVVFEEILHDLDLVFRYQWSSSNRFGFVRTATLINQSDSHLDINILDGIQNIVPFGVGSDLQNSTSNLVDAYKRSELESTAGLGIYALSAIIVDKAEPSEALEANIAWSVGMESPIHLLSSMQLPAFRKQQEIHAETDVKGEKGAYFISKNIVLNAKSEESWKIIANVRQNHAQIISLCQLINDQKDIQQVIKDDVDAGTKQLIQLNAAADGLQFTADHLKDTRHFSNTLFNIMRGGIFDHHYQIEKGDFVQYLTSANKLVAESNQDFLNQLDEVFSVSTLKDKLTDVQDVDLIRLCIEYLPLKFSRRHGDPSRPWNKFSINTQSEIDGSKILDYQGNWRDIFQNWESLAHAYPQFIEGMIFKFVNASTFDGYNPYRVTKGGFDWETIEPDNPWSYIGYWGDHQVIYLLKFLEFADKYYPQLLHNFMAADQFVYANVPYRIKSYKDIIQDPKNTIDFDAKLDHAIRNKVEDFGADGALLDSKSSDVYHVNFIEKLLAMTLAKLSNFIPEGGIWMNTQRPEWNDANNALVGNGVSMVTLYYLRRFFKFLERTVEHLNEDDIAISKELEGLFSAVVNTFESHRSLLGGSFNDHQRKEITDALGQAGSDYRETIYHDGFSGEKAGLTKAQLTNFVHVTLKYLEHTIDANKRADGLYHAYNLMKSHSNGISINHLSEMLEGQVAVLSSGYLTASETLQVLDAMRHSGLYRADQNSYMLYPNKALPGFLSKNNIPTASVESSDLLRQLVKDGNQNIIIKDIKGGYHFNGNFKNANDLKQALDKLKSSPYQSLVQQDTSKVLDIFEQVFNHIAFTGRSGTFYAYEGLGSIYWHMVSKLHLAVQEVCLKASEDGVDSSTVHQLNAHYDQIGAGIGLHKSPQVYGAFPTDPYSHTPGHRGAQQPGMTGQVKEDVLIRFSELGVVVKDGQLGFKPELLQQKEFLTSSAKFTYVDVFNEEQHIELAPDSLAFTYCQTLVVYKIGQEPLMEILARNGRQVISKSAYLDTATSEQIFNRNGRIAQINVTIEAGKLSKG